jgi:hypothetical protein
MLLPGVASGQFHYSRGQLMAAEQGAARETVSAVGTATLERRPAALRVHIEVIAKGRSLEDALANLKDLREAARVQFDALGAVKESVSFGEPSLSNVESAQRKQFEMMVRQRMTARGKQLPKGLQVPKSFAVSSRLAAEWPLESQTTEELLLESEALKEKIKVADLAGTKQAKELSPEEQELAEEMAEMMAEHGEEPVPVGEPLFTYVARITEAERDQAMADAFRKAKAQAERLAGAAGVKLGPLVALSGSGGGSSAMADPDMYGMYGGYDYHRQQYFQQLIASGGATDDDESQNQAVGTEPGGLKFTFMVNAMFAIGE